MTAPAVRDDAPAKRQQAVVVLIELRNFTRMSEMLEAAKVLELASDFFSLAARAVEEHEGEVFAVRNDSLLAAFRTGATVHFVEQAVNAAQMIQREFGALAESWERDYGLKTAVALGLHLGDAIFGTVGPKAERRRAVFGDTASITERLAHRARAGEFVMSEILFDTLAGAGIDLEAAEELPALELVRRPPIPI
ncbi:MAG: adenylate/guanylate cyclase domain-containing protein, partial [Betaproteobacteria bacterium]|nr:adenylate/guanylate cyclase domain-containing protein [Betaproteobacteria bacterium]